jgi:hypothetical protein
MSLDDFADHAISGVCMLGGVLPGASVPAGIVCTILRAVRAATRRGVSAEALIAGIERLPEVDLSARAEADAIAASKPE